MKLGKTKIKIVIPRLIAGNKKKFMKIMTLQILYERSFLVHHSGPFFQCTNTTKVTQKAEIQFENRICLSWKPTSLSFVPFG